MYYIFWAWKGNYINLGAGAELGIYYDNNGGPHWRINKKLAMDMTLKLKRGTKNIIKYSQHTWWITGFNPKYELLNVTAEQLIAEYSVRFKNSKMYEAFKEKWNTVWSFNDQEITATYKF